MKVAEINFLCVHKKLRKYRLAPMLIREVTRRVNLTGVWQAVYTAGIVLPKPVARCRYWHRSINPRKLCDINFSRLRPRMTMKMTERLYRLPDTPVLPMTPLLDADIPSATKLLNTYLEKFPLHPHLSEDEFKHWFTPQSGVVDCFVLRDGKGNVTDMTSFYHLPSTVIGHPKHNLLG